MTGTEAARCGYNPRPDLWPNIRGCVYPIGHERRDHNLVDVWVLVDRDYDGSDVLGVFTDRAVAQAAADKINARQMTDDEYARVVVEGLVLDAPATDDRAWFTVNLGDDGTIWVEYHGDVHENPRAQHEEIRRCGPDAPGWGPVPADRPSYYRPPVPQSELWERTILNIPDGVSWWAVPVAVPYATEGLEARDARRTATAAAVAEARRALAAHLEASAT